MTASAAFAAIKAHPRHTEDDVTLAVHMLAWGRAADIIALATRVTSRGYPKRNTA